MYTDDAWLKEVMGYMAEYKSMGLVEEPDATDFELQLESLQSELRVLEDQLEQEQREHDIQQQILAELARERANLGENYRVNWIEEGF